MIQLNAITKKPYQGNNETILNTAWKSNGYKYPIWLTYKQAFILGGHVKKGEKGYRIMAFKEIEKESKKDKKRAFMKYHTVFNIEQCNGDNVTMIRETDPPIEITEEMIKEAYARKKPLELQAQEEDQYLIYPEVV